MMIPKRRLLTLVFACLCFKKSLLIIIIIIIIIIIKTRIRNVNRRKKLEGILIFNLISRAVASMRQTEALASLIFSFGESKIFFFGRIKKDTSSK